MKSCVVTFPGSNCDKDVGHVLEHFLGHSVDYLWHKETTSVKFDLMVIPGGFSYGDYLRSGAMARYSAAMASVDEHVKRGGLLLGICNGFQILTEAGLLPGALGVNKNLKFVCKEVTLEPAGRLTGNIGKSLNIPIAHAEGAYYADADTIKQLEDEGRILFKYKGENPNGSVADIAGVASADGRIAGLMPHPERAMNDVTGNMDGKIFFESFINGMN